MTFMTTRYSFTLRSLFLLLPVVDIPLSIDQRKYSASYIRSYTYREIPCRVLSVVNPGQTAKLFGATEFLRQCSARYARPPSTRHIKSVGLLSRRVGSSTGMKYRFSIGHSLTLGRFRIKLPGPRRECGLYSFHSFKSRTRFRDTPAARLLMGIETFRYLPRGARCHSNRNVMAGAKKNSWPIRSLYLSPYRGRAVSTLKKR